MSEETNNIRQKVQEPKQEKPVLTEITETEFNLMTQSTIDTINDTIGDMRYEMLKIMRTYNAIQALKETGNYRVKYYRDKEGNISYKTEEKKVGYER